MRRCAEKAVLPKDAAQCLDTGGHLYEALGQKRKALESYYRASRDCKTAHDMKGQAATLMRSAKMAEDLDDTHFAFERYNEVPQRILTEKLEH